VDGGRWMVSVWLGAVEGLALHGCRSRTGADPPGVLAVGAGRVGNVLSRGYSMIPTGSLPAEIAKDMP